MYRQEQNTCCNGRLDSDLPPDSVTYGKAHWFSNEMKKPNSMAHIEAAVNNWIPCTSLPELAGSPTHNFHQS